MSEQELKIVVLGEVGVGKSTLVVQYVAGVFVEKYDPTIEDSYRKRHTFSGTKDDAISIEILDTAGTYGFSAMRDLYVKQGDAFVFAIPLVLPAAHESYIAQEVALVRRVKKLPPSASTPGMLVADLPWDPDRRSSLITLAARMQLWGYCETSAKTNTNINLLFNELAIHTLLAQGVRSERASGLKAALPWNWGKSKSKPRYVSATKTASVPPQLTEAAIAKFRFPDPLMTRSPVGFFTDLRRLLEEGAGRALADVALTVPDTAESLATHRVVLFLRSEFFRDKLSRSEVVQPIVVPGITMSTLQHVLHYLYADELPPQLAPDVLDALQEAAINLMLVDLVTLIRERLAQPPLERVLASSDSVQRLTKPYISTDAFKQLADVEVVVSDSKQVFRLHRALLWARSEWFRALLERWMNGPCNDRSQEHGHCALG